MVGDAKQFLKKVKESDPVFRDKPVFMIGISLGGASIAYTALKEPNLAKGMILLSPSLEQDVIFVLTYRRT